jgi:hypothetical protein
MTLCHTMRRGRPDKFVCDMAVVLLSPALQMLSPVAFATAFVDGGAADASADCARAFRKGPSEAGHAGASFHWPCDGAMEWSLWGEDGCLSAQPLLCDP